MTNKEIRDIVEYLKRLDFGANDNPTPGYYMKWPKEVDQQEFHAEIFVRPYSSIAPGASISLSIYRGRNYIERTFLITPLWYENIDTPETAKKAIRKALRASHLVITESDEDDCFYPNLVEILKMRGFSFCNGQSWVKNRWAHELAGETQIVVSQNPENKNWRITLGIKATQESKPTIIHRTYVENNHTQILNQLNKVLEIDATIMQ